MDDLNRQQTGLELDEDTPTERSGGRTTNSGSYRLFDSDIRATTDAFNSKIKEKKKERDRVMDQNDKRSRIRQSYIVQAIVGMRKSLREVTRLDLGDRFSFMVTTDDWQGWPRVTLSVLDETVPDAEYPRFQIVGGFRDDKAQIDLNLGDPNNTLTYNLGSESDLRKLSGIFKKSVRSFLDMIGDVILQAERAPVERQIDQVKATLEDEDLHAPSAEDGMALDSNIFDDNIEENLFDALPHLDEVDALPGWNANPSPPKPRR